AHPQDKTTTTSTGAAATRETGAAKTVFPHRGKQGSEGKQILSGKDAAAFNLCVQAKRLLDADRSKDSLVLLKKALALKPDSVDAWALAGVAMWQTGDE